MFDLAQNVFEVFTVKKQSSGDENTHLQVVKPSLEKLNCSVHTSNPIGATWEEIDTGRGIERAGFCIGMKFLHQYRNPFCLSWKFQCNLLNRYICPAFFFFYFL